MTKQIQSPNDKTGDDEWDVLDEENAFVLREGAGQREFNLEERTARFGEAIIHFCKAYSDGTGYKPIGIAACSRGYECRCELLRGAKRCLKERVSIEDWNVPEGGARDKALASDDGGGRARRKRCGAGLVAGGARTALDLFDNFAEQQNAFDLGIWICFVICAVVICHSAVMSLYDNSRTREETAHRLLKNIL